MNRYSYANPRLTVWVAFVAALVCAGCGDDDSAANNNNQNNSSVLCPAGYIYVEGGTFTMGVDEEDIAHLDDADWWPTLGPAHTVTLSPYCMSKTEISVAEYRSCRQSGQCTGEGPWPIAQDSRCNYSDTDASRDNHPVTCVIFAVAREYCQAQGGDLPSEAQWVRAAQGDDRRYYPWGNSSPTCDLVNFDVNGQEAPEDPPNGYGCAATTEPPYSRPVGSTPAGASPYGILNMGGNVSEFVRDCPAPYEVCDGELGCVDPVGTGCDEGSPHPVLADGFASFEVSYIFERGASLSASEYSFAVGFRCVHPPTPK